MTSFLERRHDEETKAMPSPQKILNSRQVDASTDISDVIIKSCDVGLVVK